MHDYVQNAVELRDVLFSDTRREKRFCCTGIGNRILLTELHPTSKLQRSPLKDRDQILMACGEPLNEFVDC